MTEMSKVEEVARAIALEDLDPETRAAVDPDKWFVSESYYALARAAIGAMRVPTEAMAKAGEDEAIRCSCAECCSQAYTAMIDAVLKE